MESRRFAVIGLLFVAVGCAKADAAGPATAGAGGSGQTTVGTGGAGVTSVSAGGTNGGSTASGGGFKAVACDKASTTTTTTTVTVGATQTTSVSSLTFYYADIPVAGLDPTSPPAVRTIYCVADQSTVSPTSTGATAATSHSGDPDPNGPSTCYEITPSFAPGHIYVGCGDGLGDGTGKITNSTRFSKIYVAM